ncbi:phospholipid-binding protein [Agrobacterium sp. a22-2]|uniref:YbhB/YbcL family Raf kinase inhibitor-like protein n=1 Tax=Agrobacterium sp. a22-2 TaxID=2283840 RepID=UPI0014456650|nr:YbhB/YbcL family Raf kinase inhibitor-like protein [Agrobacterium sp. a22-2]NKN36339.1 phospholipid-binding protein [Agrobacterium sp. a22-2]
MRIIISVFLAVLMSTPAMAEMSASFEWGPTTKCFDSKSPPFSVKNVPEGTKRLSFSMTDLNAPDYRHGGGKVDYAGKSAIPYGAFRYKGPCPPAPHKYRFTVKALDAKGKEIGKTTATRVFP